MGQDSALQNFPKVATKDFYNRDKEKAQEGEETQEKGRGFNGLLSCPQAPEFLESTYQLLQMWQVMAF